jgi:hypothetical protein
LFSTLLSSVLVLGFGSGSQNLPTLMFPYLWGGDAPFLFPLDLEVGKPRVWGDVSLCCTLQRHPPTIRVSDCTVSS